MNAISRDYKPALPTAIEAERVLLGAILQSNEAYWSVCGFLKPEHFYEGFHADLYETMGTMLTNGNPVSVITVKEFLPADKMVGDDMTAFEYVIQLFSRSTGPANAVGAARNIVNIWGRHRSITAAEDFDALNRNMPADMTPAKAIAQQIAKLTAIADQINEGTKAITMADAVDQAVAAIDDAFKFKKPAGVQTGIDSVDQLTGPWEPGQQIIIGGGTKQGKTALALQCAVGLAHHGTVFIYSGEMSVKQLAMREIARRTGIAVWKQKEGRISQTEWQALARARQEVEKLPILIEKRRLTLEQIHQQCREIKMHQGLAGVLIDHVGLLAWGRDDQRKDEWTLSAKATQELKAIYEDLGVPGMSLVQLKKNTFVQNSYGRAKLFEARLREAIYTRPKFTDLMGAVERDADHVLIPFNARPVIAGLEPEEGSDDYLVWEDRMREHDKKAEIILALSREQQFPQRRAVQWNGETTSFGPAFVGKQEALFGEGF